MSTTEYGSFWSRFLASFIDGIITSIGGGILGGVLGGFYGAAGDTNEDAQMLFFCLDLILSWLYFAIMESSAKQATLGKMAMGLVVTDNQDNRLTFGRATGRYFAKLLSGMILMIGYIMAAFTEKKQALHDMIAGTIVYQKQPLKAGRIIVGVLVSLIGFIFVLNFITLPSFQNEANKARQSEAKQYIASINKGQQAYYVERSEFSDNIPSLGLGIKLETENYSYNISKIDSSSHAIFTATAKDKRLKSYSGIVYLVDVGNGEKTSQRMICETDEPSSRAPDDFESFDKCPSGSSKLED